MARLQVAIVFIVFAGVRALQFHGAPPVDNGTQNPFQSLHLQAQTQDRFDEIQDKISDLEQSISSQENRTLRDIKAQKLVYERQLLEQHAANNDLVDTVRHKQSKLSRMQANVTALRKEAEQLMEDNRALSTELNDIERQLSIAQEFAGVAVNFSSQALTGYSELGILSELAEADEQAKHERDLAEFTGRPAMSMLLLADEDEGTETAATPEEIMQHLVAILGQAGEQRNDSFVKMRTAFERLYAEGEEKREELEQKLEALNATIEEAAETERRLVTAIEFLGETKQALAQHVNALRTFGSVNLGGGNAAADEATQKENKMTQAVKYLNQTREALTRRLLSIFGDHRKQGNGTRASFLQAMDPEQPFGALHVQKAPMEVYNNAKVDAAQLQDAIETQENASLHEIHRHKAELSRRLAEQQAQIQADEWTNNITQRTLKTVNVEIAELRTQADNLMKENVALTKSLQVMQENMSIALEFVNASVNEALQRIETSPHLEVLNELHESDEQRAHQEELNEFARISSASMLSVDDQIDAADAPASNRTLTHPEDVVDVLRSSLEQAAAERNASLAKLDETFEQLFSRGRERHTEVLRVQWDLNQSLADARVTQERLKTAVSHLNSTRAVLFNSVAAVRSFGLQRLGAEIGQGIGAEQSEFRRDQKQAAVSDVQSAVRETLSSVKGQTAKAEIQKAEDAAALPGVDVAQEGNHSEGSSEDVETSDSAQQSDDQQGDLRSLALAAKNDVINIGAELAGIR